VMGVFQSSAAGARIVGPLIAGALYDQDQTWPFWMAALLASGATAHAFGLQRPVHRPKTQQVR